MATSKTIKKTSTAKAPAAAAAPAPAPVTLAAPASAPSTLTIVVVDAQSQPVSGARISIDPSATTGTTDASGQFVFTVGNYPKYQITASYGSNSVTVPYYVTSGGASRIVVNPVYIKQVEQQRSGSSSSSLVLGGGIVVVIAVALVLVWKYVLGNRQGNQGGPSGY